MPEDVESIDALTHSPGFDAAEAKIRVTRKVDGSRTQKSIGTWPLPEGRLPMEFAEQVLRDLGVPGGKFIISLFSPSSTRLGGELLELEDLPGRRANPTPASGGADEAVQAIASAVRERVVAEAKRAIAPPVTLDEDDEDEDDDEEDDDVEEEGDDEEDGDEEDELGPFGTLLASTFKSEEAQKKLGGLVMQGMDYLGAAARRAIAEAELLSARAKAIEKYGYDPSITAARPLPPAPTPTPTAAPESSAPAIPKLQSVPAPGVTRPKASGES